MAGKEKFFDLGLSNSLSNAQKRLDQLSSWETSVTNQQPSTVLPSRRTPTIKFSQSIIFLAAAHAGDTEEIERLVRRGAAVNSVNKDGLTALHQCCIDDDFAMVKLLIKLKANIDIQDKEGWTPLHAAASCGHAHIISYLLEQGAFPALVNNDGDTPMDLAEDSEDIVEMLQSNIDKNMIDVEAVRDVEEEMILEDANRLKNDPTLQPSVSPTGVTPLHVAASKNYIQVVKILVCLKASQVQVDAMDDEGWTPLHAAVYWGHFDVAEQLVAHGADLNKKTSLGDTMEDLCDPEFEDELNTLKKYGEQNNRRRSYAISQTKQRLIHSNSREDLGGKHPSPQIVRRRSSKERSLFPKIDIAKEREERENFTGTTRDYSGDSPPLPPSGGQVPDKNHSPPTGRYGVNQSAPLSPKPSNSTSASTTSALYNSPHALEARDGHLERNNSKASQDIATTSSPSLSPSSSHSKLHLPNALVISSDFAPVVAAGYTTPPGSTPSSSDNSSTSSAAESPQGSPTLNAKLSPGTGRKKYPGMSPKMLLRVGQWESQKSIAARNSGSVASGGRGFVPVAASTPTGTNGDNPAGGGGTTSAAAAAAETNKRYSFQSKPVSPATMSSFAPRSMSMDVHSRRRVVNSEPKGAPGPPPATPVPATEEGSVGVQQKVAKGDYISSSLPWGSTTSPKRRALPEDVSASPEGSYKASSLPRGSKITTAPTTTTTTTIITTTVTAPKKVKRGEVREEEEDYGGSRESDKKAVSTEAVATPSPRAFATPSPQTDSPTPRDKSFTSVGKERRSRGVSEESSTSTTSSRGNDDSHSETSRRSRARKQRQTRKSTQPVPPDVFEQITKHDKDIEEAQEAQEAEMLAAKSLSFSSNSSTEDTDSPRVDRRHKEQETDSPRVDRRHKEQEKPPASAAATKKQEEEKKPATMSAYRPSPRPTSRITDTSVATSQQPVWPTTTTTPGPSSSSSSSSAVPAVAAVAEAKGKVADVPEQKMKLELRDSLVKAAANTVSSPSYHSTSSTPDGYRSRAKTLPAASASLVMGKEESPSNPLHPRTKSTARRRPREKRRSTGIAVQEIPDEGEVPDELKNLVRRSAHDRDADSGGESVELAITQNSSHQSLGVEGESTQNASHQTPGGEESTRNPSHQTPGGEESTDGSVGAVLVSLRGELEEERAKCRKFESERGNLEKELGESKAKNLELHRRYQDATRAYDQERRENEMKDVRLQEVQNHSKQLQELKHENQRMKDENSALIRVIGKLSRSPLPQQRT